MAIKRMLLAGAIAAGLAGAGLVGALVGGPSVGYAEDAIDATSRGGPDSGPGGDRGPPGLRGPASLEIAADALGMTEEELRTELGAGESVSSVAGPRAWISRR